MWVTCGTVDGQQHCTESAARQFVSSALDSERQIDSWVSGIPGHGLAPELNDDLLARLVGE